MDRNIPHVRDIFAPYRVSSTPNKGQELFVYDHSPGSRRRRLDAFQDFMDTDTSPPEPAATQQQPKENNNRNRNSNNNSHHRNSQHEQQQRPLTEKDRNAANKSQDKSSYSSKTLTDRDIRHLERHLSMKKTIRKQISRNLAQAFVEDPQNVLANGESGHAPIAVTTPPTSHQRTNDNYTFTLTRAKMARSDTPAFLEMLKDGSKMSEADSGHSSPSHHQDDGDDVDFDDKLIVNRNHGPPPTTTTNSNAERSNSGSDVKRPSSFWKKLGFKGKSKR